MAVAFLDVESGPAEGRVLSVSQSAVLGRSSHADLMLDDETVSREHATMRIEGITLVVEDLGSSNGTWVNDARVVEARRLDEGDVIQVGASRLRVRINTGELEAATPSDSTVILPAPGS